MLEASGGIKMIFPPFFFFFENLHFLEMKINCIVYETTKSTQFKPYNSILCHFFVCFFSFFILNISINVWHLVVWFKEYKIFLLKTMVATLCE